MRISTPTYNPSRKAWYKWHPKLQKTVYVAGDVSPDEAMRAWQRMLKADGQPVAKKVDVGTLAELINRYVTERRADARSEKISLSHYDVTARTLADVLRFFGRSATVDELGPDEWTRFARSLDTVAVSSRRRTRAILLTMFRQAEDEDWIDRVPKFGRAFRQLSNVSEAEKVLPFTRDECQRVLAEIDLRLGRVFKTPGRVAGAALKPMLNLKAAFLLGINGGLTPSDLAILRTDQVDWSGGWIRRNRNKTGMRREVALWGETIRAMKAAKASGELLFLTKAGRPLAHRTMRADGKVNLTDSVSNRFRIVMAAAGVVRPGKGLSRLRHTCRTIASEGGDESAADVLAGHRLPGMRAVYVTVNDERLIKASQHVHDWLFTPHTQP